MSVQYFAEVQVDDHAKEDGRNHVRPILAGPWCKDERQAKRVALAMKHALYAALNWYGNRKESPEELELIEYDALDLEDCLLHLDAVEEGRRGMEQPHPSEILQQDGGEEVANPETLACMLGLDDVDYFVAFASGDEPVTEPIATALSTYLDNTTPEFWLELQENYDLNNGAK